MLFQIGRERNMTIDEMKERKRELGYTNKTISDKTGLPLSTVQKIFSGATTSPREATIRALESLLMPADTGPSSLSYSDLLPAPPGVIFVREPKSDYGLKEGSGEDKKEGLYTLKDYLALPDDQRVELIDGVFYDLAAPHTIHQSIAGYIHRVLLDYVFEHKGACYPFISPVDVQLDSDDKTVVQPDVLIVCDRDKYKNGRIFGAPDMVVEVLSPSTKKKDMQLKMFKYASAGVREYWMIDPQKKLVIQYDLEHIEFPTLYGFEDQVPVLVWEGKCKVNFKEMMENMQFLFEVQG